MYSTCVQSSFWFSFDFLDFRFMENCIQTKIKSTSDGLVWFWFWFGFWFHLNISLIFKETSGFRSVFFFFFSFWISLSRDSVSLIQKKLIHLNHTNIWFSFRIGYFGSVQLMNTPMCIYNLPNIGICFFLSFTQIGHSVSRFGLVLAIWVSGFLNF